MGRKKQHLVRIVGYVKKSTNRTIRKNVDKGDSDYSTIGKVMDEIVESHQLGLKREVKHSVN